MKDVGFVGLGRMGSPMAKNLIKKGFKVAVWNRTISKSETFSQETGSQILKTPKLLADSCECIVSILADDNASKTVLKGDEGLFRGKKVKYIIEMGTLSPEYIQQTSEEAKSKGVIFIDAPVSGSTQAATEATLMVMAGANEDTVAPVMHILQAMGSKVFCLGFSGAGSIMKLSVNSIIHGLNQTVSEALILAERSGLSLENAYDVIEASAAAAPMLHYRRNQYIDASKYPVSFALSLARKDMELILGLARKHGVNMSQGHINLEKLLEAEKKGFGDQDMATIINYMRET